MDFNLEVRMKQLESLDQYISSSFNKVQTVMHQLNWNTSDTVKDNQLIKCSVDPTHRIHIANADEHITKCTLQKEGYKLDELFLSEPLHNNMNSIIIDDHKKIDIFSSAHKQISNFRSGWNGQDPDPKTADRLTSTFSLDERLALYNYAVSHTTGPPKLPDFNIVQLPKQENKSLTREELLLQRRDAKRRRIKYKSVHTNRKNHTEVLREVIDGQMQLYKDWLENANDSDFQSKSTDAKAEKYLESNKLAFSYVNILFSLLIYNGRMTSSCSNQSYCFFLHYPQSNNKNDYYNRP